MSLRVWSVLTGLSLAIAALAGCSRDSGAIRGSGTIEMDEIDVASIVGGRVLRVNVVEGDSVWAGDTLAVLARGEIAAELAAQAAEAERAQSQAKDLAQGARPAELLIAREALRKTEAELELARTTFDRTERLAKGGAVPPAELDRARGARCGAGECLRGQRECAAPGSGVPPPASERGEAGRHGGVGTARRCQEPRE